MQLQEKRWKFNKVSRDAEKKKAKAAGATGYQVYCKVAGKSAKKVAVTKAGTAKKVISKLANGKTATVKVRAYKKIGSKNYYGAWSKAVKVKVKK